MATDPTIRIELVEAGGGGTAGAAPAPSGKALAFPSGPKGSDPKIAQTQAVTAREGGVASQATKKAGKATVKRVQDSALSKATKEASGVASDLGFGRLGGLISRVGRAGGAVGRIAGLLGGGASAAGGATAAAGAAGGAAAAGGIGGTLAAGGAAIAASGPLAPIVAGVLATAAVAGLAVKLGLSIAAKKSAELAFASPELAGATAQAEAADIQSRIRQAEKLGDELATIQTSRSGIGRDIEEIKAVFLEPLLALVGDILVIVEAGTGNISDFFEKHGEVLGKLTKASLNLLAPITLVIEWWAEWAGGGEQQEGPDTIADMIAKLKGIPVAVHG